VKKRAATSSLFLPEGPPRVWAPQAFVEQLPHLALSVAELRYGPNARVILKNYMLTESSRTKSFSAIGRSVGISKQAAQAVFKKLIRRLREAMIEDIYRMFGPRIWPEFSRPLRSLSSEIKQRSETAFPHSDWDALLARTWGMSASQLGQMEPFILEILGLQRLDFCESTLDPIIITASDKDKTRLRIAARFMQKVLTSHHARGLTLEELTSMIKTRSDLRSLSADKIRALVRCAKNIIRRGNRYRIPDKTMSGRANQYQQILLRAGKPLHYRELARRAVRFGYKGNDKQHQSVANILVRDSRFVPVARSGRWALAGWRDVETRTITQIAFDEIKRVGRPLREAELCSSILEKRRVSRATLKRMLEQSRRFKRIGKKLWTTCE
jgi:hypothetical protein